MKALLIGCVVLVSGCGGLREDAVMLHRDYAPRAEAPRIEAAYLACEDDVRGAPVGGYWASRETFMYDCMKQKGYGYKPLQESQR
jgi:hypothetical protein